MEQLFSFVDGDYVVEQGCGKLNNIDPATGDIVSQINIAGENTIELAVESSKYSQSIWKHMPYQERREIMQRAAEILRENNLYFAEMEVRDTGKPLSESVCDDAIGAAKSFEFYAGLVDKIYGQSIKVDDALIYTQREPIGVCFGIGAWNYPLLVMAWKLAPALATGNSLIYKPSEHSPTSALKFAELLHDAGLPKGVFNVVLGDGDVGKRLSLDPVVRKVSLTGSVETGKKVVEASSHTLKNVSMELGGKSALLVFDDCNVEQAVEAAIIGNFYTQGEVCSNCSRVFVQSGIYDKFITILKEKTENLVIGDPLDMNTQVGSLISMEHMEKVLGYIQSGIDEGAVLLTGGRRYIEGSCSNGAFVEPTVFTNCSDDMKIVKEEIFGPVMSILRFEEEEEAINRANNTEYGLASGVFTSNLQRGHRVASQLESGVCWVNNYNMTPSQMPFGGHKQSGIGFENGLEALKSYTKNKSIYLQLKDYELSY